MSPVPVQRRLHQVVAEKAAPASHEQPAAAHLPEFRREIGAYCLEILFEQLLQSDQSSVALHVKAPGQVLNQQLAAVERLGMARGRIALDAAQAQVAAKELGVEPLAAVLRG